MKKTAVMSSLRSLLAAAALATAGASWADDVLRVPQDYPTIQAAIDAAEPGADVVVASGTYFENLVVGKTITLVSASGAAVTTLDGGRVGRVIFARGTGVETVAIVGFTIANGLGLESMDVPVPGSGSGLYLEALASATLRDNVIRDNVGCVGVGISALDVTVAIVHNQILRNQQDSSCGEAHGGGIEVQDATAVIRNNDIRDNAAASGGGIAFDRSDGVISDNLLIRNSAEVGGALRLWALDGHRVLVSGNTMLDNRATMAASAVQLIPIPDDALRMRGNTINGDGAVEVVRCETPFALSRSNTLRNAAGPAVGGACTFGLVF
jgi:Right handed beta helix region